MLTRISAYSESTHCLLGLSPSLLPSCTVHLQFRDQLLLLTLLFCRINCSASTNGLWGFCFWGRENTDKWFSLPQVTFKITDSYPWTTVARRLPSQGSSAGTKQCALLSATQFLPPSKHETWQPLTRLQT